MFKQIHKTIFLAMLMVSLLIAGVAVATTSTTVSGNLVVGSTTATGAAINISLGWTPKYVIVSNPATTSPTNVEWSTGMAAASCLKSVASDTSGDGTAGSPIVSRATVSCISTYAGTTSAAKGFTIGADTDLNISGDTLYYRAFR